MDSANNRDLWMVEFQERDSENGNYIVRKLVDGEVLSVPSDPATTVITIRKGQLLVLFQPEDSPNGCLLAPI